MNQVSWKIIIGFFMLTPLVILSGCNAGTNIPSLTPTLEIINTFTSTPIPPSSIPVTATPIPPTQTSTIVPTNTFTPTFTPTITPILVSIKQNAACFDGPGMNYPISSLLVSGESATLDGRDTNNMWLWIKVPSNENNCWVSAEVVELTGDPSLLPILTPAPTVYYQPTATLDQSGIKFYMISLNTGGPIGCGDSLVWFYSGVPHTGSVEGDAKAALNALFNIKTETFAGFNNPVFASSMQAQSITLDRSTGIAVVHLGGSFKKPKDTCEKDRMRAQIWTTVEQFPEIRDAIIWLGNKLLGDLLDIPG